MQIVGTCGTKNSSWPNFKACSNGLLIFHRLGCSPSTRQVPDAPLRADHTLALKRAALVQPVHFRNCNWRISWLSKLAVVALHPAGVVVCVHVTMIGPLGTREVPQFTTQVANSQPINTQVDTGWHPCCTSFDQRGLKSWIVMVTGGNAPRVLSTASSLKLRRANARRPLNHSWSGIRDQQTKQIWKVATQKGAMSKRPTTVYRFQITSRWPCRTRGAGGASATHKVPTSTPERHTQVPAQNPPQ